MAKQTLTNQFCKTAKHTGKHPSITFTDIELAGFILEVRKTGGKTFYLRYQRKGKTCVHRIGNAVAMSATEARKEARRIKVQIDLGKDLLAEKQIIRNTPTLAEFYLDYYLPNIKARKRSWITDVSIFENHILPSLGSLLMSDITRYMVNKIHSGLLANGFKPASANKIPTFLRIAFNLAIKWEIPGVTVNPVSGFDFFEENNKVERYLDKDEVARLMLAVNASDNPMLKYVVPFLLLTGARRNEALKAEWAHFDFTAMAWTIPLSKSGKVHHVPITNALLTLLQSIPRIDANPYVFPANSGKPFGNIYTAWNTARIKAGLADVRMHDLRHTFASTLVNSGRSLYEVKDLLGHHSVTVTQRYAHLSNASLMAAANCAASLLPDM